MPLDGEAVATVHRVTDSVSTKARAVLLLVGRPAWRPVGLLGALVSIAVLLPSASIALAGLVVDAAVLAAIAAAVTAGHRRPRRLDAGAHR